MLWEHTRTKPSSFKRTHSSQFQKSLSSPLQLVFLFSTHIPVTSATNTDLKHHSSCFQFPITTFTAPVLNNWKLSLVCASIIFSYFPHVSILSTADTDFVAHRTVCVWTSTFLTRVARFSHQTPPNCYSKLSQSPFEGGSPVNIPRENRGLGNTVPNPGQLGYLLLISTQIR